MKSKRSNNQLGRVAMHTPQALISKSVDTWMLYRLSLICMVVLVIISQMNLLGAMQTTGVKSLMFVLVLQALLNWPHFMISYRMLYSERSNFRKYPMATVWIPVALILVVALVGVLLIADDVVWANNIAYLVWMLAAFYLAWHYVGQAWGVIRVSAQLSQLKMTVAENKWLYFSVRVMLVWHVIWGFQQLGQFPYLAIFKNETLMSLFNMLACLGFAIGLGVFLKIKSSMRPLDDKVWGTWLTLYLWYFVLWIEPAFAVFVQLSHAMQYFVFPARVEMSKLNQLEYRNDGRRSAVFLLVFLYAMSVALGWLIFWGITFWLGSSAEVVLMAGLVASAINIHHFYTDGAIWKLRDPEVRGLLLGHFK